MSDSADTRMLSAKLETLHDDVVEMKTSLNKLADAITKLALVEERQAESTRALDRAFKALEKIEGRVSAIELKMPEADKVSKWVERAIWASLTVVGWFVLKKIGLV